MADSSPSEPGSDSLHSRRQARRARLHRRRRHVIGVVASVVVIAIAAIIATDSVRFGGDDRPSLAETVHTPTASRAPSSTSTTESKLPCRANLTSTEPLKLWVGGDSLAGSLGPALGTLAGATGVVQPYFHSRVSSGLSNPSFVDWPTLATKEMTTITPEIVVFIISTNDYPVAMNKTLDATGELAWKAAYAKEVDDMMQVLEGSGRTVLWLGAPVLGDTKQNDSIKELDAVEKDVAKKHPDVVYIDTYALFADQDGKYSSTVTDTDGKTILARSGDGVHLTVDGGNYLARAVYKVIDAQCKVTAQAVTGVTKQTIQTRGQHPGRAGKRRIRRQRGHDAPGHREQQPRDDVTVDGDQPTRDHERTCHHERARHHRAARDDDGPLGRVRQRHGRKGRRGEAVGNLAPCPTSSLPRPRRSIARLKSSKPRSVTSRTGRSSTAASTSTSSTSTRCSRTTSRTRRAHSKGAA